MFFLNAILELKLKAFNKLEFSKFKLYQDGGAKPRAEELRFYSLLLAPLQEHKSYYEHWVDVGAKSWSYIRALAYDERGQNRAKRFTAVEVEGNRLYWNLSTLAHKAQAYVREAQLTGIADYCSLDFRLWHPQEALGTSTLFSFFFPFVSSDPCLAWGLPERFVCFEDCLQHALTLTGGKSHFLSAHQGKAEAQLARACYARLGLAVTEHVIEMQRFARFWPAKTDIHVLLSQS